MKPPHVISAPKNYNFNIQGMAEIIPQTSYVCLPLKKNKQTEKQKERELKIKHLTHHIQD